MPLSKRVCVLLAVVLLAPLAASADEPLSTVLTGQLQTNRQRYGIAGQALLVARDGQVLFRGVDGEADLSRGTPVRTDSVFPMYSLSKLFASTLLMQLIEQGEIDPQAPVGAYLRTLPAGWRDIPVQAFLDHTSGVPEYFSSLADGAASKAIALPAGLQAAFAAAADKPPQFAPGTATRYTQTNYLVLAALLSAHYAKPYAQVVEERIIQPLGLQHTWLGSVKGRREDVVTSYVGRNGKLVEEPDLAWPDYAYGHAALYSSLDDIARFLQAMASGKWVGRETLQKLWQPVTLRDGRRGGFAGGWEYGQSDGYRQLGHDGGTRVRVRILFRDSLADDTYILVYLTNGSARNLWSRTLVDSVMGAVSAERFPAEALAEKLMAYATAPTLEQDMEAQARRLRASSHLEDEALERIVNNTGYSVRENLGVEPSLRIFSLNTVLFPDSSNAWDSLAEAHAANGDGAMAEALYRKAGDLARERQAEGGP